ncbi:SNARE associated Golgi protein [Aedoeadaptatus ivorii]|uniref:TVP38/TMEM64 family membrane protein n=1 Tax=Aedoeadaptatus ivorii TaxID=54006 RepID=A0A448V296_9FIRM|nr:VTT domain-containing protein [Peptoniphilus ivorii]MDQ0508116.1 putative membrane protein YdjX (TVP38/TMEM64 family) [Peptoniphilus ivorii]VEJ35847.1 SNARE associated Golgi protein [Peptoniphilus ivorii]
MKSTENKTLKSIGKLALIALIVGGAFFLFRDYFTEERISAMLRQGGVWAPVIYVTLWAVLPVFLFPVPLLVMPAGYLFGLAHGVVYTLIGCCLNITLMYFLAAKLAREPILDIVERKSSEKVKKVFFSPGGKSQTVFFIFRLIPLISYNLINYMAGILEIAFLPYLFFSLIGITPGIFAFIYLGESIHDPTSPEFLRAMLFMLLLTAASLVLLKLYQKRRGES